MPALISRHPQVDTDSARWLVMQHMNIAHIRKTFVKSQSPQARRVMLADPPNKFCSSKTGSQ